MKVTHLNWDGSQWQPFGLVNPAQPQLVLFFGGADPLEATLRYEKLAALYPSADIVGCSTAGEISGYEVTEGGGVAVAMEFTSTRIRTAGTILTSPVDSYQAGATLAAGFQPDGLQALFVISDGNRVNGSELVQGLRDHVGEAVFIAGGLAGDGGKFEETGVSFNGPAISGQIAVVGFYGESLQIGWGSVGGWTPFGPLRRITRSEANVLYELDGKPALGLYKTYLGDSADQLPGSALHFPIMIRPEDDQQEGLVRTILSIDDDKQSLTFAGNMPEGHTAQLMMASYESLVEGAAAAATHAATAVLRDAPGDHLVLMISCVGRKLVLSHRIEEEVEAVADLFPPETVFAGYYSYGEISPQHQGFCELHNQTMTITYLAER